MTHRAVILSEKHIKEHLNSTGQRYVNTSDESDRRAGSRTDTKSRLIRDTLIEYVWRAEDMAEQRSEYLNASPNLAYERASNHYRSGEYTEALQWLVPLLSDYPKNPDILHATAQCYLRMHSAEDARFYINSLAALGDARAKNLEAELNRSRIDQPPMALKRFRDFPYLLGPVILLATSILMASPELFFERTLTFPETESVGELYGSPVPPLARKEPDVLGDARGQIRVPRGVDVALHATEGARLDQLPGSTTSWIRSLTIDSPTDMALGAIAKWPRLEKLHLKDATRVTNNGFNSLGNAVFIKELHIEDAAITDSDMEILNQLQKLESLTLANCPELSGSALTKLAKLPKLVNLSLRLPQFEDQDLAALAGLAHLESLHLEETAVSNPGIHEFLPPLNVIRLSLVGNKSIGDDGLTALARMPKLEELEIEGGTYSAAGYEQLKMIESLRVLKVFSMTASTAREPRTE